MKMNQMLTIGKLAKAAHVSVETIRFYERKGLIQQPRASGSFRNYPTDYVARVQFIKRSQELGFSLKEAQELLDLGASHQAKCCDVLDKTQAKVKEIDSKIRDLNKMKEALLSLSDCCDDAEILLSDCPIMKFMTEKI